MKHLTHAIFLSVLLVGVFANNNLTVGDLPTAMIEEIKAIFNHSLEMTDQCGPPQETQISFLLYTRNNRDNPIPLNISDPSQIDPTKKVVVLIHGFLSGPTVYGMPELKDAYLNRYDCNLVILDWSKLATQLYTTCYCELPAIAQFGADLVCVLVQKYNIDISTIHLVGHSLGAHIAGYMGKYTQNQCGTIGRITGLDPAGPLYQFASQNERLNPNDATFVDNIHTNEGEFGYLGNIGSVDFHVNCGIFQINCPTFNLTDIEGTLLSIVACSHLRSLDYMAESVNSTDFIGKSCKTCPYVCVSDIMGASFIPMGENCPTTNLPDTKYWIPTNLFPPYAAGCTLYPLGCSTS